MAGFELTELAYGDLTEIEEFITCKENKKLAQGVLDRLLEAMHTLSEIPGMGHSRRDLTDKPVLFWPVYSYLIVYQEYQAGIVVIRVLGVRMDITQLL